MSKHEKHVRRERKKTDRARRRRSLFRHPTSHIPHAGGAAALAAAAVIAAGTQAYAAPVRFDNAAHGDAGHFHWPQFEGPSFILDFTAPASAQPGPTNGPTTLAHFTNAYYGYGQVSSPLYVGVYTDLQLGGYGDYFLVGVSSGDLIPSGLSWGPLGYTYITGYGSELPEGQQTYLGVRFNGPTDWQYAWVGVARTGMELEAFAWGYETEVGVSIPAGIPEPGSLALLAFGACAVLRKRRTA